jgi:pantoate--beta-alanine ligase
LKIFIQAEKLSAYVTELRARDKTIGFTPTMGALHHGHMSLIHKAKSENDISICSIFVNPTQFNEQSDLEKYPRTLAEDISLLIENNNDILFWPTVQEMYPEDLNTEIELDLEGLDKLMEGAFRPGHFAGVAQVVKRLLDITNPHRLYMGQKDFQQFSIVSKMIKDLEINVENVSCDIIREESGLAMSSRNRRLDPDIKKRASILSKTLSQAKENISSMQPSEITEWAMKNMTIPDFKPEYFTIADGYTLQAIESFEDHDFVVACTAVWAGEVRLIDNMILKSPKKA